MSDGRKVVFFLAAPQDGDPEAWCLRRLTVRQVLDDGRTRSSYGLEWLRGGDKRDVLRDGRGRAAEHRVPLLVAEVKVAPRGATLDGGAR